MSAILEADLTIGLLLKEFQAANLRSEVVEVAPAVPELNLPADAYVDVRCQGDDLGETDETVSVWINHKNRTVGMRVIVFKRQEFRGLGLTDTNLASEAARFNQMSHFGIFCLANPWGVTAEYTLPYHGGVFAEALIYAVKRLAVCAGDVRSWCV
ncbi:hypothetical protein NLI96_g13193 [Meripilus lineatus]|uniref:Uncharacterized protein n=1 Tax=Meripilus lineatus TaxID=2056292 RepID=A0AAD5UQB3_9APHY|nr:hypothetical protein NLI96_g13193 [Physisporinus lineatus]